MESKISLLHTTDKPPRKRPYKLIYSCSQHGERSRIHKSTQTRLYSEIDFPPSKKSTDRLAELSNLIRNCSHSELIYLTSEVKRLLKRDFLADLPYEIVQKVLTHLSPKELLQCCKVSRAWFQVSEDALLWKNVCIKHDCLSSIPNPIIGESWKELFIKENQLNCNWRHGTRTLPKILLGHENHVITCLEVYKDWAISGSDDSSICVWDLLSGQRLTTLFGHIGGVWSMTVLPPASDITPDSPLCEDDSKCLENIPLLISGSTDRTARIWRLDNSSWACISTLFGHHSTVRCLAGQSPFYAASPNGSHSNSTKLLNSECCAELHQSDELCQLHRRMRAASTGPDDRLFVSGSRDTTLRLWSARTGQCIYILRGHRGAVRCVQFYGVHIVSGSYDSKIRVWCAVSGSCLRILLHHTDRVYTLLFDGVRIVSGSLDTKIRVWNVTTGSLEHTFCGHQSLTSGMALDAKYDRLITSNADETIRVWSLVDGQCLNVLAGDHKHDSAVTCVQVIGNFIISSSDDGTVKLWDRISGEYLRDLICLDSSTVGGVIWHISVTSNRLVCAAGSRCGIEATKLIVLNFNDETDMGTNHLCQSQHLINPPRKLSQLFPESLQEQSSVFIATAEFLLRDHKSTSSLFQCHDELDSRTDHGCQLQHLTYPPRKLCKVSSEYLQEQSSFSIDPFTFFLRSSEATSSSQNSSVRCLTTEPSRAPDAHSQAVNMSIDFRFMSTSPSHFSP